MGVRHVYRHGKRIEIETLPDPPGVISVKQKQQRRNFLYEDMGRIIRGLDATGRVWVYLLRQQRMQSSKSVVVSSKHLKQLGVERWGKYRALDNLKQAGLIRVLIGGSGRNPRVKILR
jgi:hypothetical protein